MANGALIVGADADVELHGAGHAAHAVALELRKVYQGIGPGHAAGDAEGIMHLAAHEDPVAALLVDAEYTDLRPRFFPRRPHQVIVAGIPEYEPRGIADGGLLAHVDARNAGRVRQGHQRRVHHGRVRVCGRAVFAVFGCEHHVRLHEHGAGRLVPEVAHPFPMISRMVSWIIILAAPDQDAGVGFGCGRRVFAAYVFPRDIV